MRIDKLWKSVKINISQSIIRIRLLESVSAPRGVAAHDYNWKQLNVYNSQDRNCHLACRQCSQIIMLKIGKWMISCKIELYRLTFDLGQSYRFRACALGICIRLIVTGDMTIIHQDLWSGNLVPSSSTSTLVLPRALASRASDVSNMVKTTYLQLKTSNGCVVQAV